MSAPADRSAAAVIERARECLQIAATNPGDARLRGIGADLRDAAAAVRELVEADKDYDAAAFNYNADTATDAQCERLTLAARRRQAALARVQGGEA